MLAGSTVMQSVALLTLSLGYSVESFVWSPSVSVGFLWGFIPIYIYSIWMTPLARAFIYLVYTTEHLKVNGLDQGPSSGKLVVMGSVGQLIATDGSAQ